jgi:hypothetical protein
MKTVICCRIGFFEDCVQFISRNVNLFRNKMATNAEYNESTYVLKTEIIPGHEESSVCDQKKKLP